MPWWGWTALGVVAWLFMGRICLRWSVELDGDELDTGLVLLCVCFWFVGVPYMLPMRLKKSSWSPSPAIARVLVGESRWHRNEREEQEHAQRLSDVGMDP